MLRERFPFFGQFWAQGVEQSPTLQITVYAGPALTITVDKTAGYIGDIFTFQGTYKNVGGVPLVGYEVFLFVNGVQQGVASVTNAQGMWQKQWSPIVAGTFSIYAEVTRPDVQV